MLSCEDFREMKDFYQSRAVEYYEKTFPVDPASFLSPLADRLAAGAFVLDVGCGSGRDLLWLKNRGFAVTGFERSAALAELARNNAGCEVIEGDFTSYDFSTIRVDAVILIGALVHVPQADFASVLRNIAATLKADGLMLITVKEGDDRAEGADGRIFYLYRDHDLRTVFAALGFAVLDFSRDVSQMGTGEIWLRYLLKKGGAS
ncbi:MAG: class I SAM-dependent methyltransferase [Deltaproteobacteria bacterium]|nr:MAG: class I SAM-dependent methyltransferase [Deltaproteobacteria bacterium]